MPKEIEVIPTEPIVEPRVEPDANPVIVPNPHSPFFVPGPLINPSPKG